MTQTDVSLSVYSDINVKFYHNRTVQCWVIDDSPIFTARLSGRQFCSFISQSWGM